MSERLKPRQILQDADVPVIGAFGGLSSASYQTTGDSLYCNYLLNTVVTKRNELRRRTGSRITSYLAGIPTFYGNTINFHRFTFDGATYVATVAGRDVFLDLYDSAFNYQKSVAKINTFPLVTAGEKVSFSTVIEGDYCYLLMATKTTPLVVGVLMKRDITLLTASGSSLTGTIGSQPSTNVIANANTFLLNTGAGSSFISTSTVSQSSFNLSITTTAAHGLSTSANLKIHTFFVCYTRSASYYPGNYLYNIAARKNSVPLDANVLIPSELASNPISNESKQQPTGFKSTIAYKTNSATATEYTRVFNNQPTTEDQFEFSDGGFIPGNAAIFTNRTPAFLAFGALQTGGATSQVYLFRLRQILLNTRANVASSSVKAYIDRSVTTPVYYDFAGNVASSAVVYFSLATSNRPGISLSAVVELIYQSTGTEVDLSADLASVVIGDGFTIPLYGYSAIANVQASLYPNVVLAVGNRVLLSGYDNKVTFSNANWSYRGISWNNFQVSTIDFQTSSAYSVAIGQQSSSIIGLSSVNGVIIVATDTGIFRLSGSDPSSPPNATNVNFSRLSNEVLASAECLLVYESKVFFASNNGLFQLEYNRDNQELLLTPLSTEVNDQLANIPYCLMYSTTYRSFMIGLRNSPSILVYSFESQTWTVFKFAFSGQPILTQTYDGYAVNFASTTNGISNVHQLAWDTTTTTDLSNSGLLAPNTVVPSRTATLTTVSGNIDNLCTPAELIDKLDPGGFNLVQTYGFNNARSTSGTVVVSEYAGGTSAPILSYFVTKAFYTDKLIRSGRVRAVNLLVAGAGSLLSRLVLVGKDDSNVGQQFDLTTVNSVGTVTEKTNVNSRVNTGDSCLIRLRYTGVDEAWSVAGELQSGLRLLGWQLDTSVKKRGRLAT